MALADYTEHIKVLLPINDEDFKQGGGLEAVWVKVAKEVKAAYENDEDGTVYEGILDNDCIIYPGLNHGVLIPFEMRKDTKPVALWSWLKENYTLDPRTFMREEDL